MNTNQALTLESSNPELFYKYQAIIEAIINNNKEQVSRITQEAIKQTISNQVTPSDNNNAKILSYFLNKAMILSLNINPEITADMLELTREFNNNLKSTLYYPSKPSPTALIMKDKADLFPAIKELLPDDFDGIALADRVEIIIKSAGKLNLEHTKELLERADNLDPHPYRSQTTAEDYEKILKLIFDNLENQELITHLIQISADESKPKKYAQAIDASKILKLWAENNGSVAQALEIIQQFLHAGMCEDSFTDYSLAQMINVKNNPNIIQDLILIKKNFPHMFNDCVSFWRTPEKDIAEIMVQIAHNTNDIEEFDTILAPFFKRITQSRGGEAEATLEQILEQQENLTVDHAFILFKVSTLRDGRMVNPKQTTQTIVNIVKKHISEGSEANILPFIQNLALNSLQFPDFNPLVNVELKDAFIELAGLSTGNEEFKDCFKIFFESAIKTPNAVFKDCLAHIHPEILEALLATQPNLLVEMVVNAEGGIKALLSVKSHPVYQKTLNYMLEHHYDQFVDTYKTFLVTEENEFDFTRENRIVENRSKKFQSLKKAIISQPNGKVIDLLKEPEIKEIIANDPHIINDIVATLLNRDFRITYKAFNGFIKIMKLIDVSKEVNELIEEMHLAKLSGPKIGLPSCKKIDTDAILDNFHKQFLLVSNETSFPKCYEYIEFAKAIIAGESSPELSKILNIGTFLGKDPKKANIELPAELQGKILDLISPLMSQDPEEIKNIIHLSNALGKFALGKLNLLKDSCNKFKLNELVAKLYLEEFCPDELAKLNEFYHYHTTEQYGEVSGNGEGSGCSDQHNFADEGASSSTALVGMDLDMYDVD